jgi:CRP/FNR family transcriptional regulator
MEPAHPPAVQQAVAASRLARLRPELIAALLEDAVPLDVTPGGTPVQQGHGPSVSMVVSGLMRVFHTAPDGRQVTVRYVRRGELLGVLTLYVPRSGVLGLEALTKCRLLMLRPARARQLADQEVQLANLFAEEVSERLRTVLEELASNTFGTMRQRLVRHLLDLAAGPAGRTGPLVARVSQQELADAVGSVREVVVRLLRELREEGLIRTGRDEIELIDADRLHEDTFPKVEF